MANGFNDRRKLTRAKREFSSLLGHCIPSLKLLEETKLISDPSTQGWYTSIAEPLPKIEIQIWLDKSIQIWTEDTSEDRGFWLGFYSGVSGRVRELAKGSLFASAVDKLPQNALTVPVLETWSDGEEYYFGIYFQPGVKMDFSRSLHFVCDILRRIKNFSYNITADDSAIDLAALAYDANETERPQLIQARVGQGAYRKQLEKLWGGRCSVLNVELQDVLRASHVKPWSKSTNVERLDPHNGLLLVAHLDALFDKYLITFSPSGNMVMSKQLTEADRLQLQLGGGLRCPPKGKLAEYLDIHRNEFKSRESERNKTS